MNHGHRSLRRRAWTLERLTVESVSKPSSARARFAGGGARRAGRRGARARRAGRPSRRGRSAPRAARASPGAGRRRSGCVRTRPPSGTARSRSPPSRPCRRRRGRGRGWIRSRAGGVPQGRSRPPRRAPSRRAPADPPPRPGTRGRRRLRSVSRIPVASSVGTELTIPQAVHWTMSSCCERSPLVQLYSAGSTVPRDVRRVDEDLLVRAAEGAGALDGRARRRGEGPAAARPRRPARGGPVARAWRCRPAA